MAGVLGPLPKIRDVLDAVAKGASFLREFKEIEQNYQELCRQIAYLQINADRAQKMMKSSPLAESQTYPIIEVLQGILKELENIRGSVESSSADAAAKANKLTWLTKRNKIENLVQRARDANLHFSLDVQWQISERINGMGANSNVMASELTKIGQTMGRVEQITFAAYSGGMGRNANLQTGTELFELDRIQELPDTVDDDNNSDETTATHFEKQDVTLSVWQNDQNTQSFSRNGAVFGMESFPMKTPKCPKGCRCTCHAVAQDYQPPWLVRQFLGSLGVSYRWRSSPKEPDRRCQCGGGSHLVINYQAPTRLWKSRLCLDAYWTGAGPKATLRPIRMVPLNDHMWNYLRGSVQSFQYYMQIGYAVYPDDIQEDGGGVIEDLISFKNFEILELLLQTWAGSLSQKGISRQVWYAANFELRKTYIGERGRYVLQKLISYVEDEPVVRDELVYLHEASRSGCGIAAAIDGLVDTTAINELGITGCAPLHTATMWGHVDAVQQLIDAGADVNVKDVDGKTPLMWAAQKNEVDCMRSLMLAKYRIMDTANNGRTALHFATKYACTDAVQLLLCHSQGKLIRARDIWGNTPLHELAMSKKDATRSKATAKLLLESGDVDIEAKDDDGDTPTMIAIQHNNLAMLHSFVEAGASLNVAGAHSRNLLHIAALFCTAQVIDFLAELRLTDIDTHLQDSDGDTPWDAFLYCTNIPPHEEVYRNPTQDEKSAFVALYTGIRNRNLQRDISVLQQAHRALSQHDTEAAANHLASLATIKAENHNLELSSYYRGLSRDICAGNPLAAACAIKDDIDQLTEDILASPWDQPSHRNVPKFYDSYYEEDYDEDCHSEPDQLPSYAKTDSLSIKQDDESS